MVRIPEVWLVVSPLGVAVDRHNGSVAGARRVADAWTRATGQLFRVRPGVAL